MIFRQHSHEGDDTTVTTTNQAEAEAAGLRRRIRATFGPFGRLGLMGASMFLGQRASIMAKMREESALARFGAVCSGSPELLRLATSEVTCRATTMTTTYALESVTEDVMAGRLRVGYADDRPPPTEHCTPTRPCEACLVTLARRKDTPT